MPETFCKVKAIEEHLCKAVDMGTGKAKMKVLEGGGVDDVATSSFLLGDL